ncbi:putative oxidoreductase YjmC [Candidatus Entotheonellaceae bacterium PAL068K]
MTAATGGEGRVMGLIMQPSVLHDFTVQVFVHVGLPIEDARLAAAVRVESALRQPAGLDAFSVMRLHNTVRRLQAGGINPTPHLTVVSERGHLALLDGDNGLGAVVGTQAMQRCLSQAQERGLALVGVRHSTTLGLMAFYAMQALEHDTIGFVATNTELKIGLPPWGGMTPALGNNPFAIAVPTGQEPALVLDMSVIATRPQGTGDLEGTSARGPLGNAFMSRPVIGDHKGYGLALVLEVLTGVLTGAGFGRAHAPESLSAPAARYDLGHLFGVLDPAAFMPREQFYARMAQLRRDITQAQRAPGVERIFLPGEPEHERRLERLQHGIPVHDETPAALREFCATLGLDSPLGA